MNIFLFFSHSFYKNLEKAIMLPSNETIRFHMSFKKGISFTASESSFKCIQKGNQSKNCWPKKIPNDVILE